MANQRYIIIASNWMISLTYLNTKFDSDFIDDFEEKVSDCHSKGHIEQNSDQVPYAAVALVSQLLKVDGEEDIQDMCEKGCQ